MSEKVELSPEEFLMGAMAAVYRRIRSTFQGKKDRFGHDGRDVWSMEIEGALAEMALAKSQGLYWSGQGGQNALDVLGYEVRQTSYDNGHLILHPDDADDVRYVLITGQLGSYMIRGWLYGREGKQEKYWSNKFTREWAFAIPQGDLWEFEDDDG